MTFEEEFPGLSKHTECRESAPLDITFNEVYTNWKKAVQEHCIDKQRVSDAIKRLTCDCDKDTSIEWELDGQIDAKELLEELGLV